MTLKSCKTQLFCALSEHSILRKMAGLCIVNDIGINYHST